MVPMQRLNHKRVVFFARALQSCSEGDPGAAASLLRQVKDKQGGTTGVVYTLSPLSSRDKGREFFMVFWTSWSSWTSQKG